MTHSDAQLIETARSSLVKEPDWEHCEFHGTTSQAYKQGGLKDPSEIAVGMTGTAYHSGNRVEIRIANILENGARFVGRISRIDTDDETSGDLIIGDKVVVPREKLCHINQDTSVQ